MARRKSTTGPGTGALTDEEAKDRQFVTALARGLEVLRAFDGGGGPLGNQEIAARTDLPKPTVSRITHTLTRLGYLVYMPRFEKYRLGPGVLAFSHGFLGSLSIADIARPAMQDLADRTRATVALGDRDRMEFVYLQVCRGVSNIILRQGVGSRLPLPTSAMGMAYLAVLPDEERGPLLDQIKATADDWPALKQELDRAQREVYEHGFCVSVGTWVKEINGAGAPCLLGEGRQPMAFNIGGPAFWMTEQQLYEEYGPALAKMAKEVSATAAGQTSGF